MGKFLLFIISTILVFSAVELWLARFNPVTYMEPPVPVPADIWIELLHKRSSHKGLSYELEPGREKYSRGINIKTNSYGMRDEEPIDAKSYSVCNVLVLGDSYTFGFGVEGNETYTNRLEALLENYAPGKVVQVLNLGVGGYSSKDEALVLKYKGIEWAPELIIIGYVLNDPEIDPLQPLHRYYSEVKWWQMFHTTRLVAEVKRNLDVRFLGDGDYIQYLHERNYDKWKSVLTAFSAIQGIAREDNIPVLLVVFPMMQGGEWAEYIYGDLHSQISDAGKSSGFHTLDLTDTYSMHPQELLMIAPDDAHPNVLGHKLAAAAIYKEIQAYNLLECE